MGVLHPPAAPASRCCPKQGKRTRLDGSGGLCVVETQAATAPGACYHDWEQADCKDLPTLQARPTHRLVLKAEKMHALRVHTAGHGGSGVPRTATACRTCLPSLLPALAHGSG